MVTVETNHLKLHFAAIASSPERKRCDNFLKKKLAGIRGDDSKGPLRISNTELAKLVFKTNTPSPAQKTAAQNALKAIKKKSKGLITSYTRQEAGRLLYASDMRKQCDEFLLKKLAKIRAGNSPQESPVCYSQADLAKLVFKTDTPSEEQKIVAHSALKAIKAKSNGLIRAYTHQEAKKRMTSDARKQCDDFLYQKLAAYQRRIEAGKCLGTRPIRYSQTDLAQLVFQTDTPSEKQKIITNTALAAIKVTSNGLIRAYTHKETGALLSSDDRKQCDKFLRQKLAAYQRRIALGISSGTRPIRYSPIYLAQLVFQTATPSEEQKIVATSALTAINTASHGLIRQRNWREFMASLWIKHPETYRSKFRYKNGGNADPADTREMQPDDDTVRMEELTLIRRILDKIKQLDKSAFHALDAFMNDDTYHNTDLSRGQTLFRQLWQDPKGLNA